MATENVASSILRFKQENGEYLAVFPINTVNDVYVDINNRVKLADYLEKNNAGYIEVANDAERFALLSDDVENGFIVKVTETGNMYFISDKTKLTSEDGFALIYTTGSSTGPVSIHTYTSEDIDT